MDRDKISSIYRGPSIDASYQVSVHLAQGFQRRRLKCEKLTDDRRRTPSDGKSSLCVWQGELKISPTMKCIFFSGKADRGHVCMVVRIIRASKRNFAMRNKTTLGPGDRLRLHSKLRIWVENTPKKWKNQNKMSMAKAIGPFWDSGPLLDSPGPWPMYRLNPPLIDPENYIYGKLYSKQFYVMKFVRNLPQVIGFLWVPGSPTINEGHNIQVNTHNT
jgi:hypothetical protein